MEAHRKITTAVTSNRTSVPEMAASLLAPKQFIMPFQIKIANIDRYTDDIKLEIDGHVDEFKAQLE
jgi:hypothetical protein